ncbi:MAG TPA: FAD-binding oxidoreductase [Burkholderiaceae bacterium]|nr:FAD-binding oxidoreductase [Burkholderiaceae bacterium]
MQNDVWTHGERKARLIADMQRSRSSAPLGLSKRTSNLFRDRVPPGKQHLDLSAFCHVLEVCAAEGWVDAEGLTSYEDLVAATLPHGAMPAVVPQLKTITIGGAAAGVGIEATSFRYGLMHETLTQFDILLPDGDIVLCTPENAYRDLFFGFPNSYGTLGYALRLRQRTIRVKSCVQVEHLRYESAGSYLAALAEHCAGTADFVDGVVFGPRSLVLNVARFTDEAPWLSDYGFEHIYYRSLLEKDVDYLDVGDYLWRWDTDWFWCSKNLGAQNPLVRQILGRKRLNSRTYTRAMRFNSRWGLTRGWARLMGRYPESVIQDVDIPLAHAEEFLDFLLREIGILPIWICPLRAVDAASHYPLYPLVPGTLYVNFGFWDNVYSRVAHETGHFNRLIEREVLRLGGIKSLYSESFFTREEFARAYDVAHFQTLKAKYDPQGRALGLYEKCVQRA